MDDRELLELAANAAGITYDLDSVGQFWIPQIPNDFTPRVQTIWNPLTDDGAALRLEVELNMTHKLRFLEILSEENERCGPDYLKARKIAIVRAAAEVAKNSPCSTEEKTA